MGVLGMSVFKALAPRFAKRTRHLQLAVLSGAALLASVTMAQAERSGEMAGVSAAVRGEVMLAQSVGEVGVLVESGMPVYLGDRITTSANSGMQILLLDETVFTIGPNSDLAIDEFVYDPVTGDGRIVADMARGVVRFVTGKIPLKNPSSMDVNLPVGSIGIRGTIGLIRSVSADEANQIVPGSFDFSSDGNNSGTGPQIFMAVNQGPGLSRNDTTSRPGAFAVFDQNGNSENVTGENFGVFVANNKVTEPIRFPESLATFDFSRALVRTASNSQNEGGSTASSASASGGNSLTTQQTRQATTQTGSTMASTLDVAMAQVSSTNAGGSVTDAATALNQIEKTTQNNGGGSGGDGGSSEFTFDGMRQISSGSYSATQNVSSGSLSYTYTAQVDFGSRTIKIDFDNVDDGSAAFATFKGAATTGTYDFTSSNGAASFGSSNFIYDGECTAGGCSASTDFSDATNVDFNLTTTANSSGAGGSATLTP
ncbi:FecR family protein [Thalassospira sp. 11-3]|jgi:hypothetical protein|nr:FecR protein [Thalassospira sp. KO164]PXX32608.1 FecR family protein [Thalassospira sp. 11-3]SEE17947.1 FecR protein [Thalassospira permensis]|tara:strand:- start:62682 stop:64133 length:1452 start_codon:yes stop_codon:yes gene_type:complete